MSKKMFCGIDVVVNSNIPPTTVWMIGDGKTFKVINIGKFPNIRFFLFKIKMLWFKITNRLYVNGASVRGLTK